MGIPGTKNAGAKALRHELIGWMEGTANPQGAGVGEEVETLRGRSPGSQSAWHARLRSFYPAGNEDLQKNF